VPVTGGTLFAGSAGAVLLWSAVTGKSVTVLLRDIITDRSPGIPAGGTAPAAPAAAGGPDSANRALGRLLAGGYGWSEDPEWAALDNIATEESGWSATVVNASSGAAGIAQNINGFGPGYQDGNAAQQIAWMLSYIKGRYGDPVAAWRFHLANGWY
jgi:hypothetical protein